MSEDLSVRRTKVSMRGSVKGRRVNWKKHTRIVERFAYSVTCIFLYYTCLIVYIFYNCNVLMSSSLVV